MVWGIIAALPEEIDLLITQMRITDTKTLSGYRFYSGTIGLRQLVAVSCGGGKINAAVCTALLIHEFEAKNIVSIGVSGSLSGELKVFDIVLASETVYHDDDPKFTLSQPPYLPVYITDKMLLERCRIIADNIIMDENFSIRTGRVASGSRFISKNDEKSEIASRTGALCVDMWGAAAAQTAALFDTPFLAIRCISDDIDGEIDNDFEKYFKAAAEQPCHILLEMLTAASGYRSR